ncbi:hypothetical protein [Halomonas mongoliensis]|uniref:hypothetical protein n=1 Tax=Halomonas mongoliensis TaxID=321265 RepID=UPI00403B350E
MPVSVDIALRSRRAAGLLGAGLLLSASAGADPLEERMPAGLLIEMVDPTLCAPPPAEVADAEILAMLDSDDPEMAPPMTGVWEHEGERWRAYGQGWFNDGSRGRIAAAELILRSDEDLLHYLCLVLSPHAETSMTEGEAALVGPAVETIEGDTFMAMGLLGERQQGIGEVLADTGSVRFEPLAEDALAWQLSFDGQLLGMDAQPMEESIALTLEGELARDDRMRVVDWGSDELVDAAAPAVSEEELAEVRALFMEDISLELEPVLTPESSELVRRTVYRYDYDTFASLSDDSGWQSTRQHFLYRDGEQLVPFQRPTGDVDLSDFFAGLLAPDFVLDEGSAGDFRELLITLTGEDFFDEEEVQVDNVVNFRPDEWLFFTGTFFDHYKAFAVYTDDEGRPEKVLYRLKQQPAS